MALTEVVAVELFATSSLSTAFLEATPAIVISASVGAEAHLANN